MKKIIATKNWGMLNLEVKVFNINEGRNGESARRCSALAGYSAFVGKVREYKADGASLEAAIERGLSGIAAGMI